MPLLGRDAQLTVADDHLDDLERGHGRLLLLTGAPGIGKSRLAEEIAARGRARGARVVWSSAWPDDGAPPLWPWVQVLRALAGTDTALDQPTESATSSGAVRFAQLEAVAGVLRAAVDAGPLIVVIDDLHWADPATLRVLTFVASSLRDLACLVVGTFRTDELDRTDAGELARLGTTLAVPPLGRDMAAELLRFAVGGDPSPSVIDAVVSRSGGNPLFVWEFGQLMAETGRLDVAPAAVPGAVVHVLERRLARCSEDDVAVLRAAAVLGDPFGASLVAAVTGRVIDDVDARLRDATGDGLLTSAADGYGFSHALVRDVVLDGIEHSSRADLHRRAAIALGPRAASDPAFHAVVADHLLRAGQRPEAAQHWELAAQAALRKVAYDEAATLFGRAATCVDHPRREIELVIAQGEALLLAGDLPAARDRFHDAVAMASTHDEPELLARAVLGIGTGPVAWEVPLGDSAHTALVTDALARLPADAIGLRSMLLARLSVSGATPETQDLARARAEEALALGEQIGDPALIGQALAALNDAIAGPAHALTRRENADAIVELGMQAQDRALELLGYRFRVVADLEVGDVAAVDRDIAAFAGLAESIRHPLVTWYVPLFRGMRALLAGDCDAATRHQEAVAAAARETGSPNAELLAVTLEMGIDLATGARLRPDIFGELTALDPTVWATYAAGVATVAMSQGDRRRARELMRMHVDTGFSRLGDDSEQITTLLMFGRIALDLDDLVAAQSVYERLGPLTGLWAVDGIAACCYGPVDLELARLAIALDHHDDARVHLARARAAIERADAPLLALDAADLARRLGEGTTPPGAADPGESVFRREGQFWTLTFRGATTRVKDAKGLHDLARLLAEPGRELHVLDLASGAGRREGDLGELLDARARAEYRRRLGEIEDELADAEAAGDVDRAETARSERAFLAAELGAALGLGGRARRAGDPAERARKAVTGRIRMTIGRIGEEHPALGRHLGASVRTGTYCTYVPELDVSWTVSA